MSRKCPQEWVGHNVGVQLMMINEKGNVAVEGKLIAHDEESITVLAKTKNGGEQEFYLPHAEIRFMTKVCERNIVAAPTDVSGVLASFNGRRN